MANADISPSYDLYIGGQWVPPTSGERFPTYNPFTQKPWATISQADAKDVERAIATARETFDNVWKHKTGLERATLHLQARRSR